MKKATKGALAVSAAGVLLLGGAGTLAYWNDASTVAGGSISSGHLKLAGGTCASWQSNGVDVDLSTFKVVPGDTLTRHCSYSADMVGDHLKATVNISQPTLSGGLSGGLSAVASYTVGTPAGSPVAAGTPTTINPNDAVGVDVTVSFPSSTTAYNNVNGLTAVLGSITVTATQVA